MGEKSLKEEDYGVVGRGKETHSQLADEYRWIPDDVPILGVSLKSA